MGRKLISFIKRRINLMTMQYKKLREKLGRWRKATKRERLMKLN
jgi:hypothetical protein